MKNIIMIIIKLVLQFITNKFETNATKKKKIDKLLQEAKDAIKNKDNSKLISIFDTINRLSKKR